MKYPRAFSLKAGLKSSRRGAVEKNLTRSHEVAGLIPGLSELRIQRCSELWCRPAAVALI